jgi:hypothetical protein
MTEQQKVLIFGPGSGVAPRALWANQLIHNQWHFSSRIMKLHKRCCVLGQNYQ